MTVLDMNSEICDLRAEEERILASFTRSLIEIASVAGAPGSGTSPTAALNAMRLPAIALDQHGLVADANAAAEAVSTRTSILRIDGFSFAILTPGRSSKTPSIN